MHNEIYIFLIGLENGFGQVHLLEKTVKGKNALHLVLVQYIVNYITPHFAFQLRTKQI